MDACPSPLGVGGEVFERYRLRLDLKCHAQDLLLEPGRQIVFVGISFAAAADFVGTSQFGNRGVIVVA